MIGVGPGWIDTHKNQRLIKHTVRMLIPVSKQREAGQIEKQAVGGFVLASNLRELPEPILGTKEDVQAAQANLNDARVARGRP